MKKACGCEYLAGEACEHDSLLWRQLVSDRDATACANIDPLVEAAQEVVARSSCVQYMAKELEVRKAELNDEREQLAKAREKLTEWLKRYDGHFTTQDAAVEVPYPSVPRWR